MNYLALLVGAYLALARQNGTVVETNLTEWNNFKSEYGKVYESEVVETMRRVIFSSNKQKIDHFNQHHPNAKFFRMGLNKFADMTDAELELRNGIKMPDNHETPKNSPEAEKFLQDILSNNSSVPDSVDWRREPGRVSEVKDMGNSCLSDWAFATVGVLEGQMKTRTKDGKMVSLSAQNLVDCDILDDGCSSGLIWNAIDFIKSEGGIESETQYPYDGKDGPCKFSKEKAVFNAAGSAVLHGNEEQLKRTLAEYGPVSVIVDTKSINFRNYKSGVLVDDRCSNNFRKLNHAMLVVGYGTDKEAGDYWIVKNSWGEKWGEEGYIRMARNRNNMCGITTLATIVTF